MGSRDVYVNLFTLMRMTWKIHPQWVLLLHIISLILTTVVQASDVEGRIENRRHDLRNPDSVNLTTRGQIARFLKRVVREADDILEVLNSAASARSNDALIFGEIEELELLRVPRSHNIKMKVWSNIILSCIIDDLQKLKIYSLDLDVYKANLIAEISKVVKCDLTPISEEKLIITCIGSHLLEGDSNVKTYILEQSGAGAYALQLSHVIEAHGSSHVSLWHQEGDIMLMICSMTSPFALDTSVTKGQDYKSSLYRWTGEYFDNVQVFSPTNASASHHFVISNQHFIAEAHFTNSKGHHNCYSYIYSYSSASKMYIPLQLLPTKGAKHFTSFSLRTSGRTNTFLAVANYCQDDRDGKCNPYTTSGIYCHHHDRFVLFQEIPTEYAIQWLAIEVENNVLLAVANALTGVKIYRYNGWRFVPAEFQYTQGSFGAGIAGLAGVKLEENIVLGGVNGDSLSELPVFFNVKLRRENFLKTYHSDLDGWCSSRLKTLRESDYPDASAVNVPLSNNSKYSFKKKIRIDGDLIVLQSGNVDKVFVRHTNEVMPGMPEGLTDRVNALKDSSQRIADTMKRTVPITGNVTWPAKLRFKNMDSSRSKGIDVVDDILGNFLEVNGLPVDDNDMVLLSDALVLPQMNISQAEIKADINVNELAGQPFADYATLSGHHNFKKAVKINGDMDAQQINTNRILNELYLGIQRDLSVKSIHEIDYVNCSSASVTKLECQTLNGFNVTNLLKNVITTGEYNFIRGKLEVGGNLTYRGNLESNVTGSINLETPLKLDSFNRPRISGNHSIRSIRSKWLEGQIINGIQVPGQLLLNRSDSSYRLEKAYFSKVGAQSISVISNLGSIKVSNGSLDIMKVDGDQIVTSRKAFNTIRLTSQRVTRGKRAASTSENQMRDKNFAASAKQPKSLALDDVLVLLVDVVRSEAELDNLIQLLLTHSRESIEIPLCYLNDFRLLKKLYLTDFDDIYTNSFLEAKCAIENKDSWEPISILVSDNDMDTVTYNAEQYRALLKDKLKEVHFNSLNISEMSKIAQVNLNSAFKEHLHLVKLLLSALHQIFHSPWELVSLDHKAFGASGASNLRERNFDISYIMCDTVRQIGQYPVMIRKLTGSSSKATVISNALTDLVFSQFVSSISEYSDIFYTLRKPFSCYEYEDQTYFWGVEKILQRFQDRVDNTSFIVSRRYKRDLPEEFSLQQSQSVTNTEYAKETDVTHTSNVRITEKPSVTKDILSDFDDVSVVSTVVSLRDGTRKSSPSPLLGTLGPSISDKYQQPYFWGLPSLPNLVSPCVTCHVSDMITPLDSNTQLVDDVGNNFVTKETVDTISLSYLSEYEMDMFNVFDTITPSVTIDSALSEYEMDMSYDPDAITSSSSIDSVLSYLSDYETDISSVLDTITPSVTIDGALSSYLSEYEMDNTYVRDTITPSYNVDDAITLSHSIDNVLSPYLSGYRMDMSGILDTITPSVTIENALSSYLSEYEMDMSYAPDAIAPSSSIDSYLSDYEMDMSSVSDAITPSYSAPLHSIASSVTQDEILSTSLYPSYSRMALELKQSLRSSLTSFVDDEFTVDSPHHLQTYLPELDKLVTRLGSKSVFVDPVTSSVMEVSFLATARDFEISFSDIYSTSVLDVEIWKTSAKMSQGEVEIDYDDEITLFSSPDFLLFPSNTTSMSGDDFVHTDMEPSSPIMKEGLQSSFKTIGYKPKIDTLTSAHGVTETLITSAPLSEEISPFLSIKSNFDEQISLLSSEEKLSFLNTFDNIDRVPFSDVDIEINGIPFDFKTATSSVTDIYPVEIVLLSSQQQLSSAVSILPLLPEPKVYITEMDLNVYKTSVNTLNFEYSMLHYDETHFTENFQDSSSDILPALSIKESSLGSLESRSVLVSKETFKYYSNQQQHVVSQSFAANYLEQSSKVTPALGEHFGFPGSEMKSGVRVGEIPQKNRETDSEIPLNLGLNNVVIRSALSHSDIGSQLEVTNKCHSTVNKFITQYWTYIKCISCTFIFESLTSIISSTFIVQKSPATITQQQKIDSLYSAFQANEMEYEEMEYEEMDVNQFKILARNNARSLDYLYPDLYPSLATVTSEDLSYVTDSYSVEVTRAYDSNNYPHVSLHDSDYYPFVSVDSNRQKVVLNSALSSEVNIKSEGVGEANNFNYQLGRSYQGKDYLEIGVDMATTVTSTEGENQEYVTKSAYFVSDEHLENIISYIYEFKKFASSNPIQRGRYVGSVDKNFKRVINCSYKYLWSLRYNYDIAIRNYSNLDDCKKGLEFGRKLSEHYAISSNDIVLLTTLRDAPWLKELNMFLETKLKISRNQPITVEEDGIFRNVDATNNDTVSSPPLVDTIAKKVIKDTLKKISNLRETLTLWMNKSKKHRISRQARESISSHSEILHLSKELGKYFKQDLMFLVAHWETIDKLINEYLRAKTSYFSQPEIQTEETDMLLKRSDRLIANIYDFLGPFGSGDEFKFDSIDSDALNKSTSLTPSSTRKYFNLVLKEQTSLEKMLLQYYCNLDGMLYKLDFEAAIGRNPPEDFYIMISQMQGNLDLLAEYVQSFYEHQGSLPLGNLEEFALRLNWNNHSTVDGKILNHWQSVSSNIASVCESIMITNKVSKVDCSSFSKQVFGSSFRLDKVFTVSKILLTHLKNINLLLDINKIEKLHEDAVVQLNLTKCVLSVLATVKSINSDFQPSLEYTYIDMLSSQESCLNAAIGFTPNPAALFDGQLFQTLDYLKPLITYAAIETKHTLDCLQELGFAHENLLDKLPSTVNNIIFDETTNLSVNVSNNSSILCNRDPEYLEKLLSLTRKIIHMNPMAKTKVFRSETFPDSFAVGNTASDILFVLKTIISNLRQCTSTVSLENLDKLLRHHQLLMENTEGHLNELSDEAKLKVLMIYGEFLGGRATVAKNLILRELEKDNLSTESIDEFEVFGFFVYGQIAKYDLKELSKPPLPLSPESSLSLDYINQNMNKLSHMIIQGDLFVSTINDINAKLLIRHVVPLSRTKVYSNFHFKQKVSIAGDVKVERINGILAENFVLCKGDPELSLPVTFMKDVQIDGNVALADSINGIDISSFSKRIVLTNSMHMVINEDVTFTRLKAEKVNSPEIMITGVPLRKIVKRGQPAVLTGNKTFQILQVADSTKFSAFDVQYINNLNIPTMFRDSLWKNSDEQQMISYAGHLRTLHINSNLTTGGISYVNSQRDNSTVYLPRLSKNVIYSDKGTSVSRVVMYGNANVLSLNFYNTFDDVTSDTFNEGWLLKTTNQTISGKLYAADISSSYVSVRGKGTIFDVDIEHLSRAVRVDDSFTFTRDIAFTDVILNKSISVEGLVQGINISRESISNLDGTVIITAPKIFLASTIAKTLKLSGFLNSVHMGKHCHTSSNRNITLIGNVHFFQNPYIQILKAESNFINENFLELYWQKDKNIEFEEKISFKHLSLVEINATINNVNLRDLGTQTLHRSCNDWNRLHGTSHIKNLVTKILNTESGLVSTLNGIPFESFKYLLQRSGNQVITGNVAFHSISVEGNVFSGPQIISNISKLCQYREICVINSIKSFENHVTVNGNVVVDDNKTLQGVDVSDIFINILPNFGHVYGTTAFEGNLRLSELSVNGHVDSITVTRETLLLRVDSQVMSGLVTINSNLGRAVSTPEIKTDDWAMGLMNVRELSTKAVNHESRNILESPVSFENEVKFNFKNMELERMTADQMSVEPEVVYGTLQNLSFINQNTLKGQFLEVKGWQQIQVFEEPIERIMPIDFPLHSFSGDFTPRKEYLALVPATGNTRVLIRNFTHYSDTGINLDGSCPQKVAGFITEYDYILLTSHSCTADYGPGNDEIKVWKSSLQEAHHVNLAQSIGFEDITDFQGVVLDDKHCVLIVSSGEDRISLYCSEFNVFVPIHSIEESAQKVSVLNLARENGSNIVLFAVASQGKYPQERGYFAVWSYEVNSRTFSKIQKIELEIVVWVEMIYHQDNVYIVVVSQSQSGNHMGQVIVYRLNWIDNSRGNVNHSDQDRPSSLSRRVYVHQRILVKNPFEAHFSKLGSRLALFIIDQDGYILWYSQIGIQRFTEMGKLHLAGKQKLEVWTSHVNESYSYWIAISGQDCNYKESVYSRKDTQILRSVLRGRQFLP